MLIGVRAHLNGIAWSSEFRTVVQRLVLDNVCIFAQFSHFPQLCTFCTFCLFAHFWIAHNFCIFHNFAQCCIFCTSKHLFNQHILHRLELVSEAFQAFGSLSATHVLYMYQQGLHHEKLDWVSASILLDFVFIQFTLIQYSLWQGDERFTFASPEENKKVWWGHIWAPL